MTITFVSNYLNHHQTPVSDRLYELHGDKYRFIQIEPMEEERIAMGWESDLSNIPYLLYYYENEELCKQKILESDIVIFGGVDDEVYIEERLRSGKITVRYSERLYKEGQWKAVSPRGLIKKWHDHTRYKNKPVYLLCSGGYVASDFSIIRAYKDKMFRWGYFPETKKYDINALMSEKQTEITQILWAGRMIEWKHPEYPILLAKYLKEKGYTFHLTMLGGGTLEKQMKTLAVKEAVEDVVTFAGFRKPKDVRGYMEKANIFVFTSDYQEGWGAVLNEAMNSGCAVVANEGIGSVPFLLKHRENGFIYKNKNKKLFYSYVESLLRDKQLTDKIGRSAYETITLLWNERTAADRLSALCENLHKGDVTFCEEGPLSKAKRKELT